MVVLVDWRKTGSRAQQLSEKGDKRFVRLDPWEEQVPKKRKGWEVHTQQGKGKRDWRQFSKNNTAQVSACAPSLTPRRHRRVKAGPRSERGRAVPTREEAGIRDSRPPRAVPPASPPLSTCQVRKGASPPEPWAEVARGHPKSDAAARPPRAAGGRDWRGRAGDGGEGWRRRRAPVGAKGLGFPPRRWLPGVRAGRAWRPVSPRHRPFRSPQASDPEPPSATFLPRVQGRRAKEEEIREREEALGNRAGGRPAAPPGGWRVSSSGAWDAWARAGEPWGAAPCGTGPPAPPGALVTAPGRDPRARSPRLGPARPGPSLSRPAPRPSAKTLDQSLLANIPKSLLPALCARHPGPPLGASSSAPTGPETSRVFFFSFWKLALVCFPPPPHPPPLLRHGPGSGSWKRNKCGKRERKPELNDRMQAT
nr:basic proline-rich protein-like [Vicugna pacos]